MCARASLSAWPESDMADQQAKPRTSNPSALPSEARSLSLRAKMTIAMLVALAPSSASSPASSSIASSRSLRQVAVDSEARASAPR